MLNQLSLVTAAKIKGGSLKRTKDPIASHPIVVQEEQPEELDDLDYIEADEESDTVEVIESNDIDEGMYLDTGKIFV